MGLLTLLFVVRETRPKPMLQSGTGRAGRPPTEHLGLTRSAKSETQSSLGGVGEGALGEEEEGNLCLLVYRQVLPIPLK